MSIALSVNLNKVALLRNQRDIGYPSVVETGRLVLECGAAGLTVHPRPDERHIRFDDLDPLSELVRSHPTPVEFNIEGYPDQRWLDEVLRLKPHQATLVPDAPDARTSDEGWDIERHRNRLETIVGTLKAAGCRVALFIDPDPKAAALAKEVGVDRVELYTGNYAFAFDTAERDESFRAHVATIEAALAEGLGVNIGHDLNLENTPPLARACPGVAEASIGHAITADALLVGWRKAITLYQEALAGNAVVPSP